MLGRQKFPRNLQGTLSCNSHILTMQGRLGNVLILNLELAYASIPRILFITKEKKVDIG